MRVVALSDIHGNLHALEAILEEVKYEGVDQYLILGDLVIGGPNPIEVLCILKELDNAIYIRGNSDRCVVTGEFPGPSREMVDKNPSLLPAYNEIYEHYQWTRNKLKKKNWLSWLKKLPLEYNEVWLDGTTVLTVHASPGCDSGNGINYAMNEMDIKDKLNGCRPDLLLVGHTHCPMDLVVNNVRIINPGSVGIPLEVDLRASYAIFSINENGYEVQFQTVDYNRKEVINSAMKVEYPGINNLTQNLNNGVCPKWLNAQKMGDQC